MEEVFFRINTRIAIAFGSLFRKVESIKRGERNTFKSNK